jgi:hypothetical protein
MCSSADPVEILRICSGARCVSVPPRRHWEWANPQLHMADLRTGEQPPREERYRSQNVVLELFNKHGLHNRDLVAGRCWVVARERALGTRRRKEGRRVVGGERVRAPTGGE